MMRFIYVAVAALSLLSGGQSAPVTNCENLTQTIEIQGREQLLGRWTYAAESTNIAGSKLLTKMFVETMWTKITAADESDAMDVFASQKMLGSCYSLTMKMTLENSTLSMVRPEVSEVLLKTSCPDCLVVYSKYPMGRNVYTGLELLSRRNQVTAAELEEFTKQVECLNLPPPAIMDPEKGFCPDESPSQETENTDLTSVMNTMGPELLNMFDSIINREGGVQALIKLIAGNKDGLKEN